MRQDFERMLRLAEVEMLGRLGVNAEIELGGTWGTHGRGDFLQASSIPPTRPGAEHCGDMLRTLDSTQNFHSAGLRPYMGAGGQFGASSPPRFAPIAQAMGLSRKAKSIPNPPRHHPMS